MYIKQMIESRIEYLMKTEKHKQDHLQNLEESRDSLKEEIDEIKKEKEYLEHRLAIETYLSTTGIKALPLNQVLVDGESITGTVWKGYSEPKYSL